jgi:uncharacterized caspase-like protein
VRILILIVLMLTTATSAHAGRRVALIVANAKYQTMMPLKTPVSDAKLVSAALTAIGFDKVDVAIDLPRTELIKKLQVFAVESEGADIALVYYSGHGLGYADNNYLIPVDASIQKEQDVDLQAIPATAAMPASPLTKLRILVLDSSCNNPFSDARARGFRLRLAGDSLTAFSCEAGASSADGDTNSPYAQAFVSRLVEPGTEISMMFRKIRDDVSAATGGVQRPTTVGNLSNAEWFLNPVSTIKVVSIPPGPPSRRIALVIGNDAYDDKLGRLSNAANDSKLIARVLTAAGFDVELVLNADQREMKRAIMNLGERLSKSGRGAVGLFYYAGHGVQSGGSNYLIPIRADIAREADVDLEAVPGDAAIRQMSGADVSAGIAIFDACRDMPLLKSFGDGHAGLATPKTPSKTFVAFSTAPDAVASDGGGDYGPFATALASAIARPGLSIDDAFREVRKQVMGATHNNQIPWNGSTLIDEFLFSPDSAHRKTG